MKKRLSTFLMLLVLALPFLFSGCGGSDGGTASSKASGLTDAQIAKVCGAAPGSVRNAKVNVRRRRR